MFIMDATQQFPSKISFDFTLMDVILTDFLNIVENPISSNNQKKKVPTESVYSRLQKSNVPALACISTSKM